ncbi:MAG: tRNA (N(6)-L-threonylcarbamoyladenosine(37)-C(2))-methylthiotransferase [Thermoplasmata archaeon]|nr:MAG: tRNA (N(6)-L-threonylcarbamoyladenosine(37)-C(2))-methylthiotransferase [Thermoplasmata archaeon]
MRFYFESYGCTMNQGEARQMEGILKEKGHVIVDDITQSDALVLVTCTVIETTELKMKKRIRAYSKTRKSVVVAGCMASVQEDQILELNPDAHILVPQDLKRIGAIADELSKERPIDGKASTESLDYDKKTTEAIIPISSGCFGSCTYCITKIARGDLRSRPPEVLIKEIKEALAKGNKEIRLTSQDNAIYGLDINFNLPFLLNEIQKLRGDFRVRIGMMNPNNLIPILDEVLNAYKDSRIYKFLHIPVQSGSEDVLKRMGRKYMIDDFFYVVNQARKTFPNITISTDIIVGFPGETDDDFTKTVQLVEKLKPNILNITRFSPRPKTIAMEMDHQIPSRIAKDRSRAITKIHSDISRNINEGFVGKREQILVTEPGKNKTMMGRTDSYLPVVVEDDVALSNFFEIEIIEARDTYLMGRILLRSPFFTYR